ncbi:uncharacterized protein DUF3822 [Larkinella arboricola]|uniref:Uncharacterized protein DUF3822 n=1 Tax=Larkinella arboricola TaxID=643671 RepID=A0A327WLD0_LARAB|nr:uncharacterized protein DUF3822 [Larkinella arboricola]
MHTDTLAAVTPTVAIREDSFDVTQTDSFQLCLEMSKERFRFCVIEPGTHRCFWLEDYTFPTLLTENPLLPSLQAIYQNHPVLQSASWKTITIAVNSPSFTLIPSPLFRKEYAAQYLQLMRGNPLSLSEHALAYVHRKEEFYAVFSIDNALTDWLAATYPLQQTTVIHQSSALIQATSLKDSVLDSSHKLSLNFEAETVTVIFRKGGQFMFCNRFAYKNSTDLVYYILYVVNELKTDPKELKLVLFGEITPFAEIYTVLEQFFPQIQFGTHPSELNLTAAFEDTPDHRYFSLFGTALID